MPEIVVSLRAVVNEMDLLSEDNFHAFLNRKTGELYTGTSDQVMDAEDSVDDNFPAWEVEVIQRLREILGSKDWLKLPRRDSRDDYRVMERFCLECCEGNIQEQLLSALKGRGAFGRFRDGIHQMGITDTWYAFYRECLSAKAAEWLKSEGIEYKA